MELQPTEFSSNLNYDWKIIAYLTQYNVNVKYWIWVSVQLNSPRIPHVSPLCSGELGAFFEISWGKLLWYIKSFSHDDVMKWKHFPRYWPFVRGIHRSSVNSPHKGQWRGALMFSLICACINGCVSNRTAGDLRCHHTQYDVTVMIAEIWKLWSIGSHLYYCLYHTVCLKVTFLYHIWILYHGWGSC